MRSCFLRGVLVSVCVATAMMAPVDGRREPADDVELEAVLKQFGPPVLRVAQPNEPPAIDGRLDDAVWVNAEAVTLSAAEGGWTAPSQKTEAKVLADQHAIYVAVRCFEESPDDIRSAGLDQMHRVNSGDAVELFLDPGHREAFGEYFHVAINPAGRVRTARGDGPGGWSPRLSAKVARFDGGWAVEVAIPFADFGFDTGAIPRVWGLNVNRQRPELGVVMPTITPGTTRYRPQVRPLDKPHLYRDGEYSGWAPTYSAYNYSDSRPFHHPHRFGHAVLDVGTVEVAPPPRLFEVVYRSEFDRGITAPFGNGMLRDESFRGPGRSYASRPAGSPTLYFRQPLKALDDAMLIMVLRMPRNGRLYHYARTPDGWKCGACRHEFFITPEAAAARKVDQAGFALFPALELYDMHADKAAWKPWGRLWKGPGPWAMVTGYLSEPSESAVIYPGTDWTILRMRLGEFRRYAGRSKKAPEIPGQILMPRGQDYPGGMAFFPAPGPLIISDLVVFRGADVEPPQRVAGIESTVDGDVLSVSWRRAEDNTLSAYYRIYAGNEVLAQTSRLEARLPIADVKGRDVSIVAVDLYDNASAAARVSR
jgi:hypothetical protein